MSNKQFRIGVVGAGTMGAGIAQVAAYNGHEVVVADNFPSALERASLTIEKNLAREIEKKRLQVADGESIRARLSLGSIDEQLERLATCELVIEAIVEELGAKQDLFGKLEAVLADQAILATNTSSLSVTAIAGRCRVPARVLGLHFFNPAPLMPLVEVIPGFVTSRETVQSACALMSSWKKIAVVAKDTPGFIVNRIARPFYGESLRILEEGSATPATIDWAMRECGGFKMGPFELMDLIGNDVNYKVTESIFAAMYYDPRYRPALIQRRMVEAGRLGRKSGQGYYDYRPDSPAAQPDVDRANAEKIFQRVLVMLMNEAIEALFLKVASAEDLDLAMTKGVNYPQGLLRWVDQVGASWVLHALEALQAEYAEDRYRPSPLLRRMAASGASFYKG